MAMANSEHTVFLGHRETDDEEIIVPLPKTKSNAAVRYQQLDDRMIYAARLRDEKMLNIGTNPLLAAASPLFQAIADVSSEGYAAPAGLKEELVKRIKDFEFMALSQGCDNTEIIASRYVLCTALDEAITTKPWSARLEWMKNSLLIIFHNEANGGEKLFDDGTGVVLAFFKGPIVKALPGCVIQGALVKSRGFSGFVQLLGFQQGVF